jgi:hypothetical protein
VAGALVLRYVVEKPSLKLRDKVLLKWQGGQSLKRGGGVLMQENRF